jgi:hypothetical protein
MSDDKTTQIEKAIGALGTLERATEFQTFLLLASLAIALNITLTLTHQTNLTGFSWQFVRDHLPIGQALVFLTGFTLFMSCIVGILRYIADKFVYWPVSSLASFFRSYDADAISRRGHRPNNRVRPSELLQAARDSDDGEYLAQHNDYMEKRGVEDAAAWRTASLSFGLLVLLAIEATLPADASLSADFVHFLNSACSGLGNVIGVVVILVLLASWLFRFIEDDSDRRWVVCPKLYAKLERERQKEEEERRTAIYRNTTY